MSPLFQPWSIGPLALDNRIVIAPMCQYAAVAGCASDWHLVHLGHLALSGAGLLTVEATAVLPEGRISPADLCLSDDAQEAALARALQAVRGHSPIKVAVQLAHAGRKASSSVPWQGGAQIPPGEPDGWESVAPSALPHAHGEVAPRALNEAGIQRIVQAFGDTARRAVRLGFDGLEVHAAHGYLLHQFLSPLSNQRTDAYGGPLAHRMRLTLEVFDAVRRAAPAHIPVWVRVSATDWVPGGWDADQTVALCRALQSRGCAAVSVSSGGLSTQQQIPLGPGYQVPFAQRVKTEVGLPTMVAGLITEPAQAEAIVAAGQADAVALARAVLYDPRWPWHAAAQLGAQVTAPPQYWRSQPRELKDLFKGASIGGR
jgi:2,4-dienoyl-CoA reductase-like NADH-dependent reductase (Old Yellow Enzyme family)